jgi:hypothetical protein
MGTQTQNGRRVREIVLVFLLEVLPEVGGLNVLSHLGRDDNVDRLARRLEVVLWPGKVVEVLGRSRALTEVRRFLDCVGMIEKRCKRRWHRAKSTCRQWNS